MFDDQKKNDIDATDDNRHHGGCTLFFTSASMNNWNNWKNFMSK